MLGCNCEIRTTREKWPVPFTLRQLDCWFRGFQVDGNKVRSVFDEVHKPTTGGAQMTPQLGRPVIWNPRQFAWVPFNFHGNLCAHPPRESRLFFCLPGIFKTNGGQQPNHQNPQESLRVRFSSWGINSQNPREIHWLKKIYLT